MVFNIDLNIYVESEETRYARQVLCLTFFDGHGVWRDAVEFSTHLDCPK